MLKENEIEVCTNAYNLNNIECCHKCREQHFIDKVSGLRCPFDAVYDIYTCKEDGKDSNDKF